MRNICKTKFTKMEDPTSLDEAVTSPNCTLSTILGILLQEPDSVNIVNEEGLSPLQNAILHSQRADIIYLLLNYGADANLVDQWGDSPINNAIITYRNSVALLTVIKHLFKFGADVNLKNANGRRPLHVLFSNVEHGLLLKILEFLMKNGVDPDHARGRFRSYLLSANDIKDWSIRLEASRTLLQFGVKPECETRLVDYNINLNGMIHPCSVSFIKLLLQYLLVHKIKSNAAENLNYMQLQGIVDLNALSEKECFGEIIQYRDDLIRQLIMMRREKIKRRMTLFDFISERCASGFFYHEKDESVIYTVLEIFFSNRYTSCHDLFLASFKRSTLSKVISNMCIVVKKPTNRHSYTAIVALPADIIYILTAYLSNKDILNYMHAYWSPEETISVKRCMYVPKSKSDTNDSDPLEGMVKRMRM